VCPSSRNFIFCSRSKTRRYCVCGVYESEDGGGGVWSCKWRGGGGAAGGGGGAV